MRTVTLYSANYDAGQNLKKDQVEAIIEELAAKMLDFMKRNNIEDMKDLYFIQVRKGMDILEVIEIIGKPDSESVSSGSSGDWASCRWRSKSGKELYVSTSGNRITYISYSGFGIDEVESFKRISEEGRIRYYRLRWAEQCLQAIENPHWGYDGKLLKGRIAGWDGRMVLIRRDDTGRVASCDPRKFSRDDRILLASYLKTHIGTKYFEPRYNNVGVKIWTDEAIKVVEDRKAEAERRKPHKDENDEDP